MSENTISILGVDPGTNFLGYSLLHINAGKLHVGETGVLTLTHLEDSSDKLRRIFERIQSLIQRHRPSSLAIEAPFFGKNIQSMLKLGRAQGVTIAAALALGVPFEEYAPRRIKQAITGNGNATKQQVAAMLRQLTGEASIDTLTEDASDALAVALCHYYQLTNRVKSGGRSSSNWKSFLKEHPSKLLPGR
jgi:crossover junction endodeoxyribonuclease RuvC